MSQLIDALTALGQQIAANKNPANAAHFATIEAHLAKLDTAEGADEATNADTTAGLQAFLNAANGGATTGTPAPTLASAGTPAPTTAPAA